MIQWAKGDQPGRDCSPASSRLRWWYRNLVVATVLVETLEELDMRYPQAEEGLEGVVIE